LRGFIVRRVATGIVAILAVTLLVFLFSRFTGNPVDLFIDPYATPEDRAMLIRSMGLDRPLHEQYYTFLKGVLHGDLGRSITYERSVSEILASRFGNTLQLGGLAFVLSIAISLPVGVLAAVRRGTWWDWLARGMVFLGQSLPGFWLGIMLILLFSVRLGLLPTAGKGGPLSYVMPLITLSWSAAASMTRLVRSSMLEILSSDYIRTARSKGLTEFVVTWRHALKNALIPVATHCSLVLVRHTITGSVVVETVFGWPGVGRLAYEAVFSRDYPVIQALVLVFAIIVVVVNIVVEIVYRWLDPRIRKEI